MIYRMKTDDLIHLLAADTLPVRRHAAAWRLATSLLVTVPVCLLLMVLTLGVNPLLGAFLHLPMFWVKFGAPVVMALAGLGLVARLGRPGMAVGGAWAAWGLPVLLVWVLGGFVFFRGGEGGGVALFLGVTWRVCALNIFGLSLPVLFGGLWVLKGLAPVRGGAFGAGAGAGALASSVGAAVYALHCPELGAPFIAVWYFLGVFLVGLFGGFLGGRFLRW